MEVWKTTRTVVAAILLLALFASEQTCIHSYIIKSTRLSRTTSPPPSRPMPSTTSPRPNPAAPPRYTFDLDLPDEQRWVPILRHYDKDNLKKMIRNALSTVLPKEAFPLVDLIGSQLNKYMPDPYAGEIRGIANWLDISVGEVFAMNIMYEATAFCTSIVAVDNNNMVWHGRNLDYSFADILRNITVVLDFQRNNHTVFTSTSYVANVGVFTGMKPNVFTVSINERDKGNIYENIMGILSALRKSNSDYFVSFLAREALECDDTFDAVYRRLNNTRIIAPVYYIIGGVKPDEGVIITRGRLRSLDVNPLLPEKDKWFALETNYDRWTTPPPSDDRRDPAVVAMKAVGRENINDKTMYEVLSVPPVLNYKTVYTTLMSAARPDLFQAYIRHSQ